MSGLSAEPQRHETSRWNSRTISTAALLIVCAVYLIFKIRPSPDLHDVDGFWFAGWLWDRGFNPYGADFQRLLHLGFDRKDAPTGFVYPPNFWPVAAPLGLLPRTVAHMTWGIANLLFLAGGCLVLERAARHWVSSSRAVVIGVFFWIALMTGTGTALGQGQSSLLLWLGLCTLALCMAQGNILLGGIGLAILVLKPQLGFVFGAALVGYGRNWKLLAAGAAIACLCALPPFLMHGPRILLDLLQTMQGYGGMYYNSAPAMTGFPNLLFYLTGKDIGLMPWILIAMVAALAVGFLARRQADDPRRVLAVAVGAVAGLIPLHTYDLVFLGIVPLLLWPPRTRIAQVLLIAGSILILRPENLGRLLHVPSAQSAIFAAIGTLLFAGLCWQRALSPILPNQTGRIA